MSVDYKFPILIVDDYKTMRKIIRNLLKRLGFENIDEASDGNKALSKMREKKYGLVISDFNMEPLTGFDLLTYIREDEDLKDTPFIMMMAESSIKDIKLVMKARANNYILKPFNLESLKKKLGSVVGAF